MSIGIAIIGFGCGPYLSEAIVSVQAQSDKNWLCAVVYDPVEHDAAVRGLVQNDPRFLPVPSETMCVSSARNLGFSCIDGDLLIALDGDDVLAPDYFAVVRDAMAKDPQVRVAYTGTVFFGMREGVKLEVPYSRRALATRNMIVSSAMFRRADYLAIGGYDPHPQNLYEDWELWISILKSGGTVSFSPRPLFSYRQRAQSRWHSMSLEEHRSAREYIFGKHADFCWHTPSKIDPRRLTIW